MFWCLVVCEIGLRIVWGMEGLFEMGCVEWWNDEGVFWFFGVLFDLWVIVKELLGFGVYFVCWVVVCFVCLF